MSNNELTQALAEQVTKIGEISPEILDKIVSSHVTIAAANAGAGIVVFGTLAVIGIALAVYSAIKMVKESNDDWFGGVVGGGTLGFGALLGVAALLVPFLYPEAYAIKELSVLVLR